MQVKIEMSHDDLYRAIYEWAIKNGYKPVKDIEVDVHSKRIEVYFYAEKIEGGRRF